MELPIPRLSHDRSTSGRDRLDVLLVSMPFGPLLQPAIGLSLLKAGLVRRGRSARIQYFTLRFAKLVGVGTYLQVSLARAAPTHTLVGEWIFSHALRGRPSTDDDTGYIDAILRGEGRSHAGPSANFLRQARRMRRRASPFLERCLERIVRQRPRVVGFTSAFQQQAASLALARLVKRRRPETCIVFGGANCEGEMGAEMIRQFPFIDAVVSGEGDVVFPDLVDRVLAGEEVDGLSGVYTAANVPPAASPQPIPNAPAVGDLDDLPYPDYGDFFRQYRAAGLRTSYSPVLLFETSRGCWWGERVHCTFCGLNGATLAFRSKSAARALDEVEFLHRTHGPAVMSAVDNILDLAYFKNFLPQLAARRMGLDIFYEVKSNLKRDQVRLLAESGVTLVQPGIESLDSGVLRLMGKGVSVLQNVQLLKWCRELGVAPLWNLICGFPGESPESYDRMAALIPCLSHLPPPQMVAPLRLDRFSPNFSRSRELGFADVAPDPAYEHVYGFSRDVVARLAYFFTFRYQTPQDVRRYTDPVRRQVRAWQRDQAASRLFSVDTDDALWIRDERPIARDPVVRLDGVGRALYRACDRVRNVVEAGRLVQSHTHVRSSSSVQAQLDALVERQLMIREGGSYLSLALPVGAYRPPRHAWRRLTECIDAKSQPDRRGAA